MSSNEILTLISIVATITVGFILANQIRVQKTIINKYKGLIEATKPDTIITLQKREVEQLTNITTTDIKQLQEQVFELSNYVDHMIGMWERSAKSINQPELFNRTSFINLNMPHCAGALDKIHQLRISQGITG